MAATNSPHIANDAFQEVEFKNVGIENIRKLGLDKLLDFRNEYSHAMLPNLRTSVQLIVFCVISN